MAKRLVQPTSYKLSNDADGPESSDEEDEVSEEVENSEDDEDDDEECFEEKKSDRGDILLLEMFY